MKGKFTPIENDVLERLISINLNSTELCCALVLLRKTNGFQKTQDGISISQFVKMINKSRASIIRALNHLQLLSIMTLVEKGNSKKTFNTYTFNKDTSSWKLVSKKIPVNNSQLVSKMNTTSIKNDSQLVSKMIPTKESIQKKIYKRNIPKGMAKPQPKQNTSSSKGKGKAQTYGNTDINVCMEYLQDKLGASLDGSVKENRQYCYNLLRKMKKDYPDTEPVAQVKMLIDMAMQDKFHRKNITSFKYLFYNTQRIAQSFKSDYGIGDNNSDIQVI